MRFHIESMTYGGCACSVTHAIRSVDPATMVAADPSSRSVTIHSETTPEAFLPALEEAGYPTVRRTCTTK
jgi:copper chaperone